MIDQYVEISPTPSQQWLLRRGLARPHFWNMTTELEADVPIDLKVLERALQAVIAHHDALRMSFHKSGEDWIARVHSHVDSIPTTWMDVSDATDEQREATIRSVTQELETSLDLASPPLLHLAVFDLGPRRPKRIMLTMHHLICDMFSVRLVMRDIETAYRGLLMGGSPSLPPQTTSYAEWARKLHTEEIPSALRARLERWLQQPFDDVAKLPYDFGDPGAAPSMGSMKMLQVRLGSEESELLSKRKVEPGDVRNLTLAAAARAASRLTGGGRLSFNIVIPGRTPIFPDVDLTRTVGYFALSIPVVLDVEPEPGPETVERLRRHLTDVGVDYGVLFRRERAVFETAQRHWPALRINPVGRVTVAGEQASAFRLLRVGLREDPSNPTFYRLNFGHVRGVTLTQNLNEGRSVGGDDLSLIWEYSGADYKTDTIERLASDSVDAVRRMLPARAA